MRILFVETHYKRPSGQIKTSAVDWWRIINPANYLKKNTDWEIEIRKGVLSQDFKFGDPRADFEWEQVGQNFDLVWLSYMGNPLAFSYLEVLKKRYGLEYIIDFDDNLLQISQYNPISIKYAKDPVHFNNLKKILSFAQYLTVTNSYLKKVYKKFRGKSRDTIFVLPNYIDDKTYKPLPPRKHDKVVVGYFGGVAHLADLVYENTEFLSAISYFLGKYQDKVEFHVLGFMPTNEFNQLPNVRYEYGQPDFNDYIEKWKSWIAGVDFCIAPLQQSEFNQCKSSIKIYEAGIAKVPTIAQDFGPYKFIKNHENGIKCTTTKDWLEAFEFMMNREKRLEMGQKIYDYIIKNCLIKDHWQEWKEVAECAVSKNRI
jgi:glycosyltransferase involved in cell wall biosynthesis